MVFKVSPSLHDRRALPLIGQPDPAGGDRTHHCCRSDCKIPFLFDPMRNIHPGTREFNLRTSTHRLALARLAFLCHHES